MIAAGGTPKRRGGRARPFAVGVAVVAFAATLAVVAALVRPSRACPPPVPAPEGTDRVAALAAGQARGFGAFAGSAESRRIPSLTRAQDRFEATLGSGLDVVHVYYPFREPFALTLERAAIARGAVPLVSWNGADTAAVAAGRYDGWAASQAHRLAALGRPVLLRWFWEMDGRRKSGLSGSPEQFVAAWRHLRGVFGRAGASNARWVWCPNAFAFEDGTAQRYYPGDDAVDWVCADGYNFAPGPVADAQADDGVPARSFREIFSAFHDWGRQTGKPMIIAEFGVQPSAPGGQARWLAAAAADLRTRYQDIAAAVYFDGTDQQGYDWRVRRADAVTAIRDVMTSMRTRTRAGCS